MSVYEENMTLSMRRRSVLVDIIRGVYTRENKPRFTLAAAYIRREQPV